MEREPYSNSSSSSSSSSSGEDDYDGDDEGESEAYEFQCNRQVGIARCPLEGFKRLVADAKAPVHRDFNEQEVVALQRRRWWVI